MLKGRALGLLAFAVVVTVALAVWLGSPTRHDVATDTPDADRTADERPSLLSVDGMPPVNGAGDDAGETSAAPEPETEEKPGFAFIVGLAHAKDDPALPAGRETLEVTVVDRDGTPLPRAIVNGVWGEWHTRAYETDGDGRVVMQIPPNTRALEVVGQNGESTGRFCFVHVHPLPTRMGSTRVVVRTYREIRGRVSIGGADARDGIVRAYRLPRATREDGERKVTLYRMAMQAAKAKVAEDGTFSLEVPDDLPVALLYARMADPAFARAVETNVAPGATNVHLRAFERKALTLRLHVLDSEGRPVNGVVTVTPIGKTEWTPPPQRTDAEGRVSVPAHEGWLYRIDVMPPRLTSGEPPGWSSYRGAVFASGFEQELWLAPASASIHGAVVDEQGHPAAGAWVCVLDGPDLVACMGTNPQGEFAGSSNAPAGTRLRVYARFPREGPTSRGYVEDVVAGDRLHIELEELGPLEAKNVK